MAAIRSAWRREETKAFAPLHGWRDVAQSAPHLPAVGDDEGRGGRRRISIRVRAHVIGAGTMGGDIAGVCVLAGMEVSLQDQTLEQVEKARKRCETLFRKRLDGSRRPWKRP